MDNIRPATLEDISRLAEIEVFNYRLNFYPVFRNDAYYFGELTVANVVENYRRTQENVKPTYVYDDGVVKGFIRIEGGEVVKLFVEPVLQGQSIGAQLLNYAIAHHAVTFLWALEKNDRALRFYLQRGFHLTGKRKYEEGTTEYLVRLKR
ncbi:putative acetyltransferase [uncultured Clostridium sp.]|nr:putative acetyltransferase [uncultured Clostridium sp.]